MSEIEEKMKTLGYTVPEMGKPVGSYVPAIQWGDLVMTSGQLPLRDGKVAYTGKLGGEFDAAQGYEAARLSVLSALAAVKGAVGDLDRVQRVVKVTGYVASAEGFTDQPAVVNGASDLLTAIWGENGTHCRSAVGVAELPLGAAVEVELTVAIRP